MIAPSFFLFATVWLSVFAWAGAEVLKAARPGAAAPARALWTAGAILLAVHTAIAFHVRHGWSHDAAFDATARQSEALTGVAAGWGLYLNYLFVLVWIADAAWWWLAPRSREGRARAFDLSVFALFLFMMLNGAVIFAASPMRVAGALAVTLTVLSRTSPGALRSVYSGRP